MTGPEAFATGPGRGFADPARDSHSTFRAVLDALSRPGEVSCAGAVVGSPPPLGPAMAAVLLTLTDADTLVWLDPAFAAAQGWLAFHTGAPPAARPGDADFVCAATLPDLSTLRPGDDEAPETAATVLLGVTSLSAGPALKLSGPGVSGEAVLLVDGLPSGFCEMWARNRARFPRGVDLILCAGTSLAALPRGVSVRRA